MRTGWVFAFVFVFLVFFSMLARADDQVIVAYRATNVGGPWVSDVSSACKQYVGNAAGWSSVPEQITNKPYFRCHVTNQTGYNDYGSIDFQMGCPNGQQPDANGQCPQACSDTAKYNRRFTYTATPDIGPTHWGMCNIVIDQLLVCRKGGAGGDFCMWQFHRDGSVFKGKDVPGNGGGVDQNPVADDTTLPTTSSPIFSNTASDPKTCTNCIPCPAGSVNMGVDQDGVPLCVGTGTNPKQPAPTPTVTTSPDVTTQGSDGSTTTIGTKTQQNADGSTTTTTTTTVVKADGTKTVSVGSTTGNTSAGSQGTQDTPDTDKNNLCKQNPTLTICQNSSVSGTCGSITCTGDAIQCATLRATAAMQCQQKADVDALASAPYTTTGTAILSGSDPAQADIDKNKAGTQMDVSNPGSALDDSGFVGGGACLPDRTVVVLGKTVTIQFGYMCDKIAMLRPVVLALAALAFAYIVMGGIVSSGESSSV